MSGLALVDAWSVPAAREFFMNVWPMYVHDLSAFDSDFFQLDARGRFLPDIAGDWVRPTTPAENVREGAVLSASEQPYQRAHVIVDGGRPAGFACVGLRPFRYMPRDADVILSELFLVHRSRARGVGLAAFRLLTERYSGRWTLSAIHDNARAIAFWRKTLAREGVGALRESVLEREVVWEFVVPGRGAR